MTTDDVRLAWDKMAGLVPAIVQDANSGRVLMLGYMNEEALQITRRDRRVTFYSRSRNKLWTKGETSGNFLSLQSIEVDCDSDALLVHATPSGPTCHLGRESCFDSPDQSSGFGFIGTLESVIAERVSNPTDDSYTAQLVASGVRRVAQKVGEEGVEVALAGAGGSPEELVNESADLLFHLLLLLQQNGASFATVSQELQRRHAATLSNSTIGE